MNRVLAYINAAGVLCLAALCVFQWRANRTLNLEAARLARAQVEQTAKLEESEKARRGCQADLEDFRERVTLASRSAQTNEQRVLQLERESHEASAERDALKASLGSWEKAIGARDEQIKLGNEQIAKLAASRDEAAARYNDLAARYNDVVKKLNEARAQLAATTK